MAGSNQRFPVSAIFGDLPNQEYLGRAAVGPLAKQSRGKNSRIVENQRNRPV